MATQAGLQRILAKIKGIQAGIGTARAGVSALRGQRPAITPAPSRQIPGSREALLRSRGRRVEEQIGRLPARIEPRQFPGTEVEELRARQAVTTRKLEALPRKIEPRIMPTTPTRKLGRIGARGEFIPFIRPGDVESASRLLRRRF